PGISVTRHAVTVLREASPHARHLVGRNADGTGRIETGANTVGRDREPCFAADDRIPAMRKQSHRLVVDRVADTPLAVVPSPRIGRADGSSVSIGSLIHRIHPDTSVSRLADSPID